MSERGMSKANDFTEKIGQGQKCQQSCFVGYC